MKAKAVRIHGPKDLRVDEFELPPIKDDEILVKVISNSLCLSDYKCSNLGPGHKRVPDNVAEHPAVIGHEFAGEIVEVGKKYEGKFKPGMRFTTQPDHRYKGTFDTIGYTYEYCGGNSTYAILPMELMATDCLLEYKGEAFFEASLAEPMSCNIGAFHTSYHVPERGVYKHEMGIKKGGKLALIGAGGPMGMGALSYALNRDDTPSLITVTDVSAERLARLESIFPVEEAKKKGITLTFLNPLESEDIVKDLMDIVDGKGYDDVFCYAIIPEVVKQCDDILASDGCLNFFAGPMDPEFAATINFYDVHYNGHHHVGSSGGNRDDIIESLALTESRRINPAVMVTHIGGLNAVPDATFNLPTLPGGKKLIYTHTDLPLIALTELRDKASEDERYGKLADIVDANNGLWSLEAENFVLDNFVID